MIDIKKDLVSILKIASSLPVYYEVLYKPGTVPAITYIQVDDADLYLGDRRNYSTLRYEIKIWDRELSSVINNSIAIDAAMKSAGWSRYAAFEINDNATIIKVLRYVATGYDEV